MRPKRRRRAGRRACQLDNDMTRPQNATSQNFAEKAPRMPQNARNAPGGYLYYPSPKRAEMGEKNTLVLNEGIPRP